MYSISAPHDFKQRSLQIVAKYPFLFPNKMANRDNIANEYAQRRRQSVVSLLLFANKLVKAGRISEVSKCFLKGRLLYVALHCPLDTCA